MKKINLIVGGGLAGLIIAKKLLFQKKKDIVLVEATDQLGGLLKSHNYENHGAFDMGTHYFANVYGEEINEILQKTLNKEDWSIHKGVRSDLSGVYHNGKWNLDTVFVDLFSYSKEERENFKQTILDHQEKNVENNSPITAKDYLNNLYGKKVTNQIFDPILKKLYGYKGDKLHPFAAQLYPLSRVVMSNEKEVLANLATPINQIIAFPSQVNLPAFLHPNHYSYYPKNRGIGKVVEVLEEDLIKSGVKIYKSTKIENLDYGDNIERVTIHNKTYSINQVFSSLPVFSLAKLLGINVDFQSLDSPNHTVLSHLKVLTEFDFKDRHYMYCYDNGFKAFRITNYNAITLAKENPVPLTIESSFKDLPTHEEINRVILKELKQMKIIEEISQVKFLKHKVLPYGFPILTKKNMVEIEKKRRLIKDLKINNLITLGIFSDATIFFMRDILRKIEETVK